MILLATDFDSLHQILRNLYQDMMPLCATMTGIAKGIAGLGALFYVAHRVWQSLSRAKPIDVYPPLGPFIIGLCIMFFPTFVLGTVNMADCLRIITSTQMTQIELIYADKNLRSSVKSVSSACHITVKKYGI